MVGTNEIDLRENGGTLHIGAEVVDVRDRVTVQYCHTILRSTCLNTVCNVMNHRHVRCGDVGESEKL